MAASDKRTEVEVTSEPIKLVGGWQVPSEKMYQIAASLPRNTVINIDELELRGAGTTTWIRDDGATVEMNTAYSDTIHLQMLAEGWRVV